MSCDVESLITNDFSVLKQNHYWIKQCKKRSNKVTWNLLEWGKINVKIENNVSKDNLYSIEIFDWNITNKWRQYNSNFRHGNFRLRHLEQYQSLKWNQNYIRFKIYRELSVIERESLHLTSTSLWFIKNSQNIRAIKAYCSQLKIYPQNSHSFNRKIQLLFKKTVLIFLWSYHWYCFGVDSLWPENLCNSVPMNRKYNVERIK